MKNMKNNPRKVFKIFSHYTGVSLLILLAVVVLAACSNNLANQNVNPVDDVDYTPTKTVTESKIEIYDGPGIITSSSDISIRVEDRELFVYDTLVNHERLFNFREPTTTSPVSIFDFEGSVDINITVKNEETIESAVIRPLVYDIEPTISGNTISFTLDYPANYVIEYDGKTEKAINLFTNQIEVDKPVPDNIPENMVYIGPGVYKADAIPVKSNQTIYIAGGAVVFGQIRAENVENVTIKGRGIISGDVYSRTRAADFTIPIEFRHSKNIQIKDISFLNPAGWTISAYFVDNLEIDNIRIITARANGDGISIQSCKNVLVKNSFVRSWDDGLVVKNYDRGISENIIFDNIVLWNDLAQSMEIGYETNGDIMKDITFKNITVLHNFHKPVISIHNADDADISNILYKNITIEDARMVGDNKGTNYDDFFVDFQILYNQEWSSSGGERGTINNVTIDNVLIIDGKDDLISRIAGYDKDHRITDVNIKNVSYKGKKVNTAEDLNLYTNDNTADISVGYSMEQSTGAKLILPYKLDLKADDEPEIIIHKNITQKGYIIPEFAIKEVPQVYSGAKVNGDFTALATHGTGFIEWDDGSGAYESELNVARNVLDGDTTTSWIGKEWTGEKGEYVALSIKFDNNKKIGTIRVYGNPDSQLYTLQNIALYGMRATSSREVYTKILNSKDYEFSPANGNYIEIRMNPGEYKAIQLRFYNKEGNAYPEKPFVTEVEMYPASLTFNKAVSASPHEDVYEATNLIDGNPLTYYESKKGEWPAQIIIDMAANYSIGYINLNLPPLMQWETRTQNFSIQVSTDGNNYTEIIPEKGFTFNPQKGNLVQIEIEQPVSAQFIKFIFTGNTSPGGEGAQLSEISVYE